MARPTVWRRSVHEYADLGTSPKNNFRIPLATLATGETLTRTLLTWQIQHAAVSWADGTGFMITAGIIVVPGGTPIGNVPSPLADPNADWVWWESQVMQPVMYIHTGTQALGIDAAPFSSQIRESRGQRVADTGPMDIWFASDASTLSPTQTEHFLSMAVSLLVLEPAV